MITPKLLVSLNACEEQYQKFVDEWPDGAEVTVANVLRAIEIDLDLDWFIREFFTPTALDEYERVRDAALAEYEKATAPALAEFERVRDTAWAEFEKATAPALAEYERAIAPAWAEYEKARDAAWAEYKKVRAEAFVTAYKITTNQAFDA